ncbi:hypothetical protein [Erythrobacter longus]|nr:hypothetical protein [Erythrobacter longus]
MTVSECVRPAKGVMIFALLAASLPLAGHDGSQASDGHPSFCARLAANIGIDDVEVRDGKASWKANALNLGQRVLFGGTATTSVDVAVVEPATVDDYRRASDMCAAQDGGAVCRLTGPVTFEFGWKGSKSETAVMAGEISTVTVQSTKAMCEDQTLAVGAV